ncbi:MAG: hypothetical protein M1818_000309 [Claussenomyces sp. TS43310]|nr:MAG: hypothetical protein M1818_000309 [Claussenomyces sp. TS43310]
MPATSVPLPKVSAHRRTLSTFGLGDSRSSSIQKVWAEDYYTDDMIGGPGTCFEDVLTPPKPATLTERPFPRSIPLSYDEQPATPRQTRTHQRSLTALLPFRSPQKSPERTPQPSPNKERAAFDFMPTLTGDTEGQIKVAEKGRGGLSGWFSGTSAPVQLGVPDDEFETIDMSNPRAASPERNPVKPQWRGAVPSLEASPTTNVKPGPSTSRFAFFSQKSSTQPVQIPATLHDEFLNLDIPKALFPVGRVASDPFSPSAFKTLLVNAEGLLDRLQTAYKQRTLTLHELSTEKEVQADELEEAETRATHLKLQLEGMAQRVVEQDEEMLRIKAKLVAERTARKEERDAREKSISLLKLQHETARPDFDDFGPSTPAHSRRKWRSSSGTICSDTSLESDDDSAESVFSRSMSPSLSSVSEMPTNVSTPEVAYAKMVTVRPALLDSHAIAMALQPTQRPKTVQQRSTFQRILKGISTTSGADDTLLDQENELGMAEQGCRNCRGGDASVAWDTVGLLRAENKVLKEQVQSLDRAVEGALNLVAGLGSALV